MPVRGRLRSRRGSAGGPARTSDDAPVSAPAERSVRVSTLELFFDLVFVFTITQLTGVLVDGQDAAAVAQVVVMLLLIWWMYDGYAWLTNAIATDRFRSRLLLIGGMGGFLVIALAVPKAYDGSGLAFGLGVPRRRRAARRDVRARDVGLGGRAILRIAPFNLVAVALVLVGGGLGGDEIGGGSVVYSSGWLLLLLNRLASSACCRA